MITGMSVINHRLAVLSGMDLEIARMSDQPEEVSLVDVFVIRWNFRCCSLAVNERRF